MPALLISTSAGIIVTRASTDENFGDLVGKQLTAIPKAVLILLMTLFTTNVLDLSIFPTVLLVTTLFRLGLNLSSTRLIL
ncbi:hypothetical protein GSQ53_20910, partial [Clostridioides difficile]|nr:hypothetical protein [Clostridioides difficile]